MRTALSAIVLLVATAGEAATVPGDPCLQGSGPDCFGPFTAIVTPGASAAAGFFFDTSFDINITMVGAEAINGREAGILFTSQAIHPIVIEGNFRYVSTDTRGPAFDIFGTEVGGRQEPLTDANGPIDPFSAFRLSVDRGENFGWFIRSTDGAEGPAIVSVNANVVSVIPVPPALPLLLAGLGGLVMLRRRRAA
jgi:hypothetical protein